MDHLKQRLNKSFKKEANIMRSQGEDCMHVAALKREIAIVLKVSPFSMSPGVLTGGGGKRREKVQGRYDNKQSCS